MIALPTCVRPPLSLLLVTVTIAGAVATGFPGEARAGGGARIELAGGSSLVMSNAVQNLAAPDADTMYRAVLSVSGAVGVGPWVGGVALDGAFGWFDGRADGFVGAFTGVELLLDRALLRGVVEGGMHAVSEPGSDATHISDARTVDLPYVGLRIAVERSLVKSGHNLALGVSAFARADLATERVTAGITHRCAFGDFDCDGPWTPATFDVGGLTIGLGVSLTFGSGR
jgi:hypothetical protein